MTTPLLQKHGITDKKSWYKWILKNHPDKGGDHDTFTSVKNDYEKYIRDGHKYYAPPSGGGASASSAGPKTQGNPFPRGSTNWYMFEEVLRQMRNRHSQNSTGGWNFNFDNAKTYTQSDGFAYTYAQNFSHSKPKASKPSGKFWDQPTKPKPKVSKRKGCYGQATGTRIWCDNPVEEGEKFCKKCKEKKCNHLVKDTLNRGRKQCSRKKRPDDDFCNLHSKKPPQKRMTQESIQCNHIKKNNKRCGNKSKNKYCHLHQKYHTSEEGDKSSSGSKSDDQKKDKGKEKKKKESD